MGKKNREERLAAHRKYEQRQNHAASLEAFRIAPEHIPLAADFIHANYHTLTEKCLLDQGVLSKIAKGRFAASIPQKNEITRVAQAAQWMPPEA
jgi:hypothetical protein